MLFNIINYDNQVIGQVEAGDATEAWSEAGKKYENVLDVRLIEIEAINMVCVQCGRVYKFKPPEIELGVCVCGGIEYRREVPVEKEGLYIKWIRAHGKEARYQFIESFLGWKIFMLVSGDTQYFDRYYAESPKLGKHPKAENTLSEIQESIRVSELSHSEGISEPPYGERLREWVSLYGGYIEYHSELEGYKIRKKPEDITKPYMFANSQTRKQDVRMYLVGE